MYTRLSCLFILAAVLLCASAVGQAPSAPGAAANAPAAADKAPAKGDKDAKADASAPPATPAPPPKPKGGDIITLNDGTVIDGVQIVKESPRELLLQITSEVKLSIPRSQVKSIQRDNISAEDVKHGAAAAAQKDASGVIPGMKLSGKLSTDISKPPANFNNEDLGNVLAEMCKRAGVDVILDQSVMEMPEAERRWTYQSDPNTPLTVFNLLKDVLPKQFPSLEALYLQDKVVVASKKAVEALKNQGAVEIPGPGASATPAASVTPTSPAAPTPPAAPAAAPTPAPVAPAAPAPAAPALPSLTQ
jgi:hypothetical protein